MGQNNSRGVSNYQGLNFTFLRQSIKGDFEDNFLNVSNNNLKIVPYCGRCYMLYVDNCKSNCEKKS